MLANLPVSHSVAMPDKYAAERLATMEETSLELTVCAVSPYQCSTQAGIIRRARAGSVKKPFVSTYESARSGLD